MEKILIIEDDAALRMMVQRALRNEGYEVHAAQDGVEGTVSAKSKLPDLILCDVRMDKLDGYGTLEALRKDPATCAIPFILMTGQADYAGMRQGMELGADDYLPKPFTVPELTAAVRARLSKATVLKQQADKRLAELRVNISCSLPHEMRTPLNGIIGFSEMIVSDYDSLPADDVISMAKAINDSAKRLHRLIENTLLYAQLELATGDESRMAAFRRGFVEDVARTVERTARQRASTANRPADLHLTLTSSPAGIAAEHLARVLDELLDNAFKFSTSGKAVFVTVESVPPNVRLSIKDSGRGMKPEYLTEIGAYMQFERKFFEQQGSGLGLTIAKRLTELHGGTLTLRSEPGVGTEIVIDLPVAAHSRPASSPATSIPN
jgi:signal transduction histidine kinase